MEALTILLNSDTSYPALDHQGALRTLWIHGKFSDIPSYYVNLYCNIFKTTQNFALKFSV